MKRKLLLLVALIFILQLVHYYHGFYSPPEEKSYRLEEIEVEAPSPRLYVEAVEQGQGVVVFDMAHGNSFSPDEVSSLLDRLAARGYSYEFAEQELNERLKYANSLVVISPGEGYSEQETSQVKSFLEKGGRLLLVSDPQREDKMNSLSSKLGIRFEGGYLYNMKRNDGNFRNVYFENFSLGVVTKGLRGVVLYSSCPVTSPGKLMFGGGGTRYSRSTVAKNLSPAVGLNSTLAICDLTFFTNGFNSMEDNPKLISNIADYLASGQRRFLLEDFPHFLDKARVVYADPSLMEQALRMKQMLPGGTSLGAGNLSGDGVIVAYFEEPGASSDYLGGINISGDMVEAPELGEFESRALIYLNTSGGREVLVVLARDYDGMEAALSTFEKGEIHRYLATERLAIITGEQEAAQVAVPGNLSL